MAIEDPLQREVYSWEHQPFSIAMFDCRVKQSTSTWCLWLVEPHKCPSYAEVFCFLILCGRNDREFGEGGYCFAVEMEKIWQTKLSIASSYIKCTVVNWKAGDFSSCGMSRGHLADGVFASPSLNVRDAPPWRWRSMITSEEWRLHRNVSVPRLVPSLLCVFSEPWKMGIRWSWVNLTYIIYIIFLQPWI